MEDVKRSGNDHILSLNWCPCGESQQQSTFQLHILAHQQFMQTSCHVSCTILFFSGPMLEGDNLHLSTKDIDIQLGKSHIDENHVNGRQCECTAAFSLKYEV